MLFLYLIYDHLLPFLVCHMILPAFLVIIYFSVIHTASFAIIYSVFLSFILFFSVFFTLLPHLHHYPVFLQLIYDFLVGLYVVHTFSAICWAIAYKYWHEIRWVINTCVMVEQHRSREQHCTCLFIITTHVA